jgi:hypothetical protein
VPDFPDEDDLTFWDIFRRVKAGIVLCEVLVLLQNGRLAPHYTVADTWRRILFLGAGEVREEWVAGIIGVTSDDMRHDIIEGVRQPRLDTRLREDLRVMQLLRVRLVKVKAAPQAKPSRPTNCDRKRAKRLAIAK